MTADETREVIASLSLTGSRALSLIVTLPREEIAQLHELIRPHRIGVFDYDSLVECLRLNFDTVFPGEDMRDPQNGIWRLAAEVLDLRRAMAQRSA